MAGALYLLSINADLARELKYKLVAEYGVRNVVSLQELSISVCPAPTPCAESSLFWRIKNRPPYTNAPASLRRYFMEQEWRNLFLSYTQVIPTKRFFNHPFAADQASSKPFQLSVARQVGLQIPRTIVTNNKGTLITFIQELPSHSAIVKPLDTTYMGNPDSPGRTLRIPVREISLSEAARFSEEQVAVVPVILQERIEKQFELRVIVYGDHGVIVKIDSQRHTRSSVDWRLRQHDQSMFSLIETDEVLVAALVRYLRTAQLDSGVFDLAVTTTGDIVFFECNPNGEWRWIDRFTGGSILDLAARTLAEFHAAL